MFKVTVWLSYLFFDCDEIIHGVRIIKETNKKIIKKILDETVGWEISLLCHIFETLTICVKCLVLFIPDLNGSHNSTQNSLRKTIFRLKIRYFLNFLDHVLLKAGHFVFGQFFS